jgi:hypothetical protein
MARQEAMEAEREIVADAAERTLEFCKKYDFVAAKRVFRNLQEFESDEAKADLALAQNRVDRLEAFHQFLIKNSLNHKPAGQNWTVTAVTARAITINGRETLWPALDNLSMFALIKSLVSNDAQARSLLPQLRDRANMRLNAALHLSTHMKNVSPFVLQEENSLRDKAIKELPSLEDEVEKLLGEREE